MAYSFLPAERDQLYLVAPSVRDWLPEEHLAWFVLDVVEALDLSVFYARYRVDGLGRAAYEPSVMVSVLLYAYCVGERSSRRIERRCREDIAYTHRPHRSLGQRAPHNAEVVAYRPGQPIRRHPTCAGLINQYRQAA